MAFFRFGQRTPDVRFDMVNCNNAPAVVVHRGDVLEGVFLLEIFDDKITNFYAMRNPAERAAGQARRVHRPPDGRALAASTAGLRQRKTPGTLSQAPGVLRDGPVEI